MKKRSFVGGRINIFADCCNFVTDAACLRAAADAYAEERISFDWNHTRRVGIAPLRGDASRIDLAARCPRGPASAWTAWAKSRKTVAQASQSEQAILSTLRTTL
jgi:hypothetical protein